MYIGTEGDGLVPIAARNVQPIAGRQQHSHQRCYLTLVTHIFCDCLHERPWIHRVLAQRIRLLTAGLHDEDFFSVVVP